MIVDFWAITIFAVIIITFFIIFSIEKKANENNLIGEFADKDVNFMLESFLRAPAEGYPGKTVADIIVEDEINDGKYERTRNLFEAYFKRANMMNYKEINDILLNIDGKHDEKMKMVTSKGVGGFGKAFLTSGSGIIENSYTAEAYIPGYEGKIYITLRLSEIVAADEPPEDGVEDGGIPSAAEDEKDKNTRTSIYTPSPRAGGVLG